MNLQTLLGSQIVETLGWTLINSLWQIALVAGLLFVILRFARTSAPDLRYGLSVGALVISLTLPVVTFVQISGGISAGQLFSKTGPSGVGHEEAHDDQRTLERSGSVAFSQLPENGARNKSSDMFAQLRGFFGRNLTFLMPFAVGMWLLGVAVFSFRLFGGVWQLRQYKTRSVAVVDEHWKQVFVALCEKLDIGRQVKLLRSTLVETPIAIGIFKPLIIVPASAFLQISPRELETIIAHELIHIRRYDPLVNMAQGVIEALFFYHPGVWWISRQISREREFATDSTVMEVFSGSHVVYASALANLEEIRHLANKQMPRIATAANGGNLMQRIQRILKTKTEVNRANSAWSAGLAVVLISAVLAMVFSFNSTGFVNAHGKPQGRKLAVGFVSIPPLDRTENPPKDSDATARLLIHALKVHKVPATGFLQGGMISDGEKMFPVRAEIARMWIDAGFEVGLGGFKHLSFYNTPVDEYIANIEKNEKVAKKLLGDMGQPPRYFSYPYLNTGKSAEDRTKVEAWLSARGYTPVKYTFDNQEWMYSYAYDMARNDNDVNTMKEVRASYLDYMSKMFDHYEGYSAEMFGRDIPQTLVLTSSRLVTDTADEFFTMAKKRGYSFVSIDEAQSDPAYKTAEGFVGDAGISWFERWTMAKSGKLRDEPKVEATVWKTWETRAKK